MSIRWFFNKVYTSIIKNRIAPFIIGDVDVVSNENTDYYLIEDVRIDTNMFSKFLPPTVNLQSVFVQQCKLYDVLCNKIHLDTVEIVLRENSEIATSEGGTSSRGGTGGAKTKASLSKGGGGEEEIAFLEGRFEVMKIILNTIDELFSRLTVSVTKLSIIFEPSDNPEFVFCLRIDEVNVKNICEEKSIIINQLPVIALPKPCITITNAKCSVCKNSTYYLSDEVEFGSCESIYFATNSKLNFVNANFKILSQSFINSIKLKEFTVTFNEKNNVLVKELEIESVYGTLIKSQDITFNYDMRSIIFLSDINISLPLAATQSVTQTALLPIKNLVVNCTDKILNFNLENLLVKLSPTQLQIDNGDTVNVSGINFTTATGITVDCVEINNIEKIVKFIVSIMQPPPPEEVEKSPLPSPGEAGINAVDFIDELKTTIEKSTQFHFAPFHLIDDYLINPIRKKSPSQKITFEEIKIFDTPKLFLVEKINFSELRLILSRLEVSPQQIKLRSLSLGNILSRYDPISIDDVLTIKFSPQYKNVLITGSNFIITPRISEIIQLSNIIEPIINLLPPSPPNSGFVFDKVCVSSFNLYIHNTYHSIHDRLTLLNNILLQLISVIPFKNVKIPVEELVYVGPVNIRQATSRFLKHFLKSVKNITFH